MSPSMFPNTDFVDNSCRSRLHLFLARLFMKCNESVHVMFLSFVHLLIIA